MNLLIMGPPGAGKGTQAEIISNKLDVKHLSSGDMLRSAVAIQSDLGKRAEGYMKAGELVPDELMIQMILSEVQSVLESSSYDGFLLDGFPRTVVQAKALDESFDENGVKIDRIISLDVDAEEVVQRLTSRRVCGECKSIFNVNQLPSTESDICPSCGAQALVKRKDDEEQVIRNRLEVYSKSTFPILSYYSEVHSILNIDGSQEKDTITDFILGELGNASSRVAEV